MFYRLCRVREISPGTHTFFPTYTCPVYCWRSVQLLDFGLCCNLIHASQPIRTTFTGQCFAYGFLQTSPHNDALAFSCILPTAGRIRDFHPLERAPAGRTTKTNPGAPAPGFVSVLSYLDFLTRSLPHPASADSCRRRYRYRTRWPCQGWSPRRSRRGARCSRLPP